MKSMKRENLRNAMTIAAAAGLIAVAAPVAAGTVLGGATVTNGARGVADGSVIDGPVKVVMPGGPRGRQFDAMAANINLPAGVGGIDWHIHPGPTFGIVTGGTLTIIDDDCVGHVYAAGEAFVAPRNPHTARNFSDSQVTVRATFLLPHTSPATAPTVFVSASEDDVLDAYCNLAE